MDVLRGQDRVAKEPWFKTIENEKTNFNNILFDFWD